MKRMTKNETNGNPPTLALPRCGRERVKGEIRYMYGKDEICDRPSGVL